MQAEGVWGLCAVRKVLADGRRQGKRDLAMGLGTLCCACDFLEAGSPGACPVCPGNPPTTW